jgi:hypothetical protein
MTRKFLENDEEFFTSYLEKMGMAWWVEIVTEQPKCIYYFGPFASRRKYSEADTSRKVGIEMLVG